MGSRSLRGHPVHGFTTRCVAPRPLCTPAARPTCGNCERTALVCHRGSRPARRRWGSGRAPRRATAGRLVRLACRLVRRFRVFRGIARVMPPGRPGGRGGHCLQMGGRLSGRLLVLGCGSLAREISLAIPLIASRYDDDLTLMVAARDADRARWLAQLVRARSFAAGVCLTVRNYKLDWNSVDQMAAMITAAAPTVILNTASLQSFWSLTAGNGWSRLVRQGGYGVTVALQGALLPQLGGGVRRP